MNDLDPVLNPIVQFVGQFLAYAGGAAAVAFLIFRFLGEKWIEDRFSRNLEQLRHGQAVELQRLRVNIDSLLNGAILLQEREFEVLPEAWYKLDAAYTLVADLVSPLQFGVDLDTVEPAQLEELLNRSELTPWQKDQVKLSDSKSRAYEQFYYLHQIHCVQNTVRDFRVYVHKNAIFMPEEIAQQFELVSKLLSSALITFEIAREGNDFKMRYEAWQKVTEQVDPARQEISSQLKFRLRAHGQSSLQADDKYE